MRDLRRSGRFDDETARVRMYDAGHRIKAIFENQS
jgi:hypothetical protein